MFKDMRAYLRTIGHPYADNHAYGDGPNWRFRTIRTALRELGLSEHLLRHGVQREVFWCPLAENAEELLLTGNGSPNIANLLSAAEVSSLAKERWMLPRSYRNQQYRAWERSRITALLEQKSTRGVIAVAS